MSLTISIKGNVLPYHSHDPKDESLLVYTNEWEEGTTCAVQDGVTEAEATVRAIPLDAEKGDYVALVSPALLAQFKHTNLSIREIAPPEFVQLTIDLV